MRQGKSDKSVLIIDDNEDDYRIISRYISNSYKTEYCSEKSDFIKHISSLNPACILLDYHMGIKEGIKVLEELKSTDGIKRIPVIMMTGEENPDIIIECMKNNADDYLIKGRYDKEKILHAIEHAIINSNLKKKIEEQQTLILNLSRTDELTGVFSRRYLIERIEEEILRSKRSKAVFSVTMVDLDHFKNINDVYGHLAGDAVLKKMTKIIKTGIRNTDYVGRYGGDEFVIVLLDFDKTENKVIVKNHANIINNIRKSINNTDIIFPDEFLKEASVLEKKTINVSGTFGIALYNDSISTFSDFLAEADRALYEAKENGRNCVAFFDNKNFQFFK